MSGEVIVVGAGLAGLSCATHLARAGVEVVVLEASDGVGGRVRSDVVGGFTLDRGFQVLLLAYPELAGLVDLAALDLRRFDAGALVLAGGGAHRLADPRRRPGLVLETLRAPVATPADLPRLARLLGRLLLADPARPLQGPDRSTAELLGAAGFSPRFVARFWRPLFAGIQLDPDLEVSARRFLLVLRSLATGATAVPAAGMGALPAQLAAGLPPGSVRLATPVAALEGASVVLASGERLGGRAVVVAADGPAASSLLGLEPVPTRATASVWFAAATPPFPDRLVALDGDGTGPAANLAVMSNVAPEYAPTGQSSMVAAVPGTVGGDDLEAQVLAQCRRWFGEQVDGWRHLRTDRIPRAHPDQRPGFPPTRAVRVGEGRYVCGDHRDTASIQGALFSGRRAATAVLADLGHAPPPPPG